MSTKIFARYTALVFALCTGFLLTFQEEAHARSKHHSRPHHGRHHQIVPQRHHHPRKHIRPPVILTQDDRECMIRNVFWESSAALEPPPGNRMVAHVTLMRLIYDISGIVFAPHGQPGTICEAVRARKQFSWSPDPRKWLRVLSGAAYREAVEAADDVLHGWVPPEPLQRALYYMRPEFSDRKNVCAFRTELFFILKIGNHEYYTPPMDDFEKQLLAEANAKKKDRCAEKTDYILIQEYRLSQENKNP
ncbi:cell wall hydrolase [Candidatus Kaiserbacteria bacterium]|nr:cell wall hydrolase [Candidatus Kaiserbacteria bacterium]